MSAATSSVAQQGFRRGMGRGNMGAPVEKPKNGKETLARLVRYFAPERAYVLLLAAAVIIAVAASVIAPSLQSKAIDHLVTRSFDRIPHEGDRFVCLRAEFTILIMKHNRIIRLKARRLPEETGEEVGKE